MNEEQHLYALLEKTSRTFALSIPLLPEPTRSEVVVAYLVFRIIDTLEDATEWSSSRRVEALEHALDLLQTKDTSLARLVAEDWLEAPPVRHAGYLELLAATPMVLGQYRRLGRAAREQIGRYAAQSARGMIDFIGRSDSSGQLRLESLGELQEYCFVVAGVVGQMLTELFVLGRAELEPVAGELRQRAVRFGEGLQLVNILKDARADAAAGRAYLPPNVALADVFALARADLEIAAEYNGILKESGTERGIWAFNALNTQLATAALKLLQAGGLGSKLTRLDVSRLRADILHAVAGVLPHAGAA